MRKTDYSEQIYFYCRGVNFSIPDCCGVSHKKMFHLLCLKYVPYLNTGTYIVGERNESLRGKNGLFVSLMHRREAKFIKKAIRLADRIMWDLVEYVWVLTCFGRLKMNSLKVIKSL